MRIPFEPRTVDERNAADENLADIVGKTVLGADSAEERVPACMGWSDAGVSTAGRRIYTICDFWGVQKGEI